jgi:hypothetical protein
MIQKPNKKKERKPSAGLGFFLSSLAFGVSFHS